MKFTSTFCAALFIITAFTIAHAQTSVTTWTGTQAADLVDGKLSDARFNGPWSITRSSHGNFYVADAGNNVIRKITADGIVSTLAGDGNPGWLDGDSTQAEFNGSTGVCVDDSENVYVADFNNQRIRKISSTGKVTTIAGSGVEGYADGPGLQAKFDYPRGICIDNNGVIYVGDSWNHRIRKIAKDGTVSTFAGGGTAHGVQVAGSWKDGQDTSARFWTPCGVAYGSGNIYVADAFNHRIRKITSTGMVSTIAGSGPSGNGNGGHVDGDAATSRLNTPTEVCSSGSGIWFSDTYGNCIRRTGDGAVMTLAGNGTQGYRDANLSQSEFSYPRGLYVDDGSTSYLSMYICDFNNNCIRWIDLILDVKENPTELISSVYPNPASEKCTLQFSDKLNPGIIRLFDYLGREHAHLFAKPGTQTLELSLSNQPTGMYYISILGHKSVAIEKR